MFTKIFKGFKKFIKALTSRFVVVTMLIILQAVLWALFFTALSEAFLPLRIVSAVLSLVLALYIINKEQLAEYKLPWLLVVTLLPPFGIIIYLIFGNNQPGRKMQRQFSVISQKAFSCIKQDAKTEKQLKKESLQAYGQAKYLQKTSSTCVHSHTHVKYFPTGEAMFPALIEELKKAKHFIFMEYFIIEEGLFWDSVLEVLKEKVEQGVEVRFMYDDVGSIGKVGINYVKKLREAGLNAKIFRPFRPFVSVVHNNRDHRKITVIDNNVAFTGGVNLADEYINTVERFGYWKDNSVMMKGRCVRDITALFLSLWDLQAGTISDYDRYVSFPCEKIEEKNGYCSFYGDGPNPFYPEQVGKDVYLNIINSAEEYVYITTPYLVCDETMLSALRLAARRGVDVRIVVPHIPDKKSIYLLTRSNYQTLKEAGVKIYEYTPGFIHAKTFLSDDKYAVVSTINLDYRSLVHHFECGLWMYNVSVLPEIKDDLEKTIKNSKEVDEKGAKLNVVQVLLKDLMGIFTPLL